MQKNRLIIFFFIIIISSSCQFFKTKKTAKDLPELKNPVFATVFGEFENHLLRGINFEENKKSIKRKEDTLLLLIEEEDFILQYEYDLPKDSLKTFEYCNINYLFNDKKLDIVTIEYFLKDSTKIENTYKSIISALNFKYGENSEDEFGYQVWEGFGNGSSQKGKKEEKYEIGVKRNYKIEESNFIIEFSKMKEK